MPAASERKKPCRRPEPCPTEPKTSAAYPWRDPPATAFRTATACHVVRQAVAWVLTDQKRAEPCRDGFRQLAVIEAQVDGFVRLGVQCFKGGADVALDGDQVAGRPWQHLAAASPRPPLPHRPLLHSDQERAAQALGELPPRLRVGERAGRRADHDGPELVEFKEHPGSRRELARLWPVSPRARSGVPPPAPA